MNQARDRILSRLRARKVNNQPMVMDTGVLQRDWETAEQVRRFTDGLTSNHAEVITTQQAALGECLRQILHKHAVQSVLLGRHSPFLPWAEDWEKNGLQWRAYDAPIEQWQDALFTEWDAAITTTVGGIAETGTLMLWPTPEEPRLMSLVPPLHIAVLAQSKLHATFAEALAQPPWQGTLPTNALLISGPSKTADIEQTLVYGAHGPSELVVVVIEDQ
ncbi:MAG: LutC/YkgG family protein [Saccharospirillum sp.]